MRSEMESADAGKEAGRQESAFSSLMGHHPWPESEHCAKIFEVENRKSL